MLGKDKEKSILSGGNPGALRGQGLASGRVSFPPPQASEAVEGICDLIQRATQSY